MHINHQLGGLGRWTKVNTVSQFFNFAVEASHGFQAFWKFSLVVFVGSAIAILYNFPRGNLTHTLSPISLFFFPIAILLWGVLMPHNDSFSSHSPWVVYVLYALLLSQSVATIVVIAKTKGHRYYSIGIGTLAGYYTFFCSAISAGSVTGASI